MVSSLKKMYFDFSCGKNVSPSTQQEHHLIFYIDLVDLKDGESIQELVDTNLHAVFEQRCCQNDIDCISQINSLPKYDHHMPIWC
jgi:hypothetical protein